MAEWAGRKDEIGGASRMNVLNLNVPTSDTSTAESCPVLCRLLNKLPWLSTLLDGLGGASGMLS